MLAERSGHITWTQSTTRWQAAKTLFHDALDTPVYDATRRHTCFCRRWWLRPVCHER